MIQAPHHSAHEPADPFLRAAMVAARRRGGSPFLARGRFRAAQRLAAGMTPAEAARAEGADEAAVTGLLGDEGFRALVESQRALATRPESEQLARLVLLARQAIECALLVDWDMGTAFFVLREHEHGRDPARTVAKSVLATARREAAAAAALPPPPRPLAPLRPLTQPRYRDPLDALVHRQTAALRRAVTAEHASPRRRGGRSPRARGQPAPRRRAARPGPSTAARPAAPGR
jgi:hypothetical protein